MFAEQGVGIHTRFCIGRSLQQSSLEEERPLKKLGRSLPLRVREDSLHIRAAFPPVRFCRLFLLIPWLVLGRGPQFFTANLLSLFAGLTWLDRGVPARDFAFFGPRFGTK